MKKILKKTCFLLLCTAMSLTFNPKVTANTVKLNKTKTNVYIGNKTTLKVSGTNKHIMWTSSNTRIATVNDEGVVSGKNLGTATISAKIGSGNTGKTLKCTVSVKNRIIVPKSPVFINLNEYEEILIKTRGLKKNESIGFIDTNGDAVNFDWDDDILIAEGRKLGTKTITIQIFQDGFPAGKEKQNITAYVFRDNSGWISWKDLKRFANIDKFNDGDEVEYIISSRKDLSSSTGIVKYSLSFYLPNDITADTIYLTNRISPYGGQTDNVHYKLHNGQLYFNIQDLINSNLI